MKERPILFSAPMVRAILAGAKTQTRRVVKPPIGYRCPDAMKHWTDVNFQNGRPVWLVRGEAGAFKWMPCPYGQPGDRLWVRETWAAHWMYDDVPHSVARSNRCDLQRTDNRWFAADGDGAPSQHGSEPNGLRGRWRPSIHTPRWASRITLEITGVRVERLQDIRETDAQAEGAEPLLVPPDGGSTVYTEGYRHLWEQINGPGSWDANPFVWVVEFRRAK